MIYGYARVSTDGQSGAAQVAALRKHGAEKVVSEVASGAKTDRAKLRRVIDQFDAGGVLTVTRLDQLALSTRDLLNTLATITAKKAGFKSLGDTWADTTTSHGRLMLTVLGGLAEFERDLIRTRTGEGRARALGARAENGPTVQTHRSPEGRSDQAPRPRRDACRHRPQLQRQPGDDFTSDGVTPAVMEAENLDLARVHKKLAEAQFFLRKMIEQERRIFGDGREPFEPFDYYLSAFLNAGMSVRGGFQYRQNPTRNKAIKAWRGQWENNLSPEQKTLYEFMRMDRVAEVHASGSSRTEAREGVEFGIGTHHVDGGIITIGGPPGMPPTVVDKRTYNFTTDGAVRKATEACADYLALLQQMVARFEADHP
jgi:DNA invertase Pin-like site-specific DNA recombinase